jgi:hypothetical protein
VQCTCQKHSVRFLPLTEGEEGFYAIEMTCLGDRFRLSLIECISFSLLFFSFQSFSAATPSESSLEKLSCRNNISHMTNYTLIRVSIPSFSLKTVTVYEFFPFFFQTSLLDRKNVSTIKIYNFKNSTV